MDAGNFNMPGGFAHIYNKDEVVIPPEKAGIPRKYPLILFSFFVLTKVSEKFFAKKEGIPIFLGISK